MMTSLRYDLSQPLGFVVLRWGLPKPAAGSGAAGIENAVGKLAGPDSTRQHDRSNHACDRARRYFAGLFRFLIGKQLNENVDHILQLGSQGPPLARARSSDISSQGWKRTTVFRIVAVPGT